ncbi:MAG: sigma-70 family RNA polymerase sigma factor [Planctomycetales bacterium]|nr:sigma-70 family RNA polymerase sigma factor [Planctomycetales bacterium]
MTTTPFLKKDAASDEQLLLAYRETDNARAFEQLVRRYEKDLYGFLHRFLQDAELAEDAFQATFLQLHLKCREFTEGRPLRPWLYRIAKNQAIDLLRRTRRHRLLSLDQPGGEPQGTHPLAQAIAGATPEAARLLEQRERDACLREATARLPGKLREIIKLVYFEGLKYREAAEALSLPLGTLKSRMHRALRLLGQDLATNVAAAA